MLNNFASTQGGGTDTVTTTMILDGTIANADVASDAAIDLDKLSQASEQKLGIGTEPTETLHVRDGRTTGGSAGLLIQKFEAVDGTSYGAFVEATGGSTKNIGLYVQAEGGTTNYGLLVPNGSVGIGTTSTSSDLEIEGSSGDLVLEIDNNVTNSANLKIKCDAGSARADFALDGSNIITMKSQMVGIGDTSPSYALDVNGTGRYVSDVIVGGNLTVGDAGAEDQKIVFDGNAQDFYIGLDDTDDDLVIGLGSAVGTTPAISINEDQDVTIADGAIDFDIASHDATNGLKLGGTLVTSSAAELNMLDGKSIGIRTDEGVSSDH